MSDQGAWEAGLRQQIKRGIDLEAIKKRADHISRSLPTACEIELAGMVRDLVAEVERLKEKEDYLRGEWYCEIATRHAVMVERDEARETAQGEEKLRLIVMEERDGLEAKIEAALDIKPFPRWGDSGHPVVWHDDLVKALTGGREK